MSRYEKHKGGAITVRQGLLTLELAYAKKTGNISLPVEPAALEMIGDLLADLADIAWNAPGGHGYQIDEARRWAAILTEKT